MSVKVASLFCDEPDVLKWQLPQVLADKVEIPEGSQIGLTALALLPQTSHIRLLILFFLFRSNVTQRS